MVEAQLAGGETLAAVLAQIVVASEDVATVELHHLPGQSLVVQQANHTGNLDLR